MSSITGENRILAYEGLKRLNENPRLGFQQMIPTNIKGNVNVSNVVFSIAPKINAAGRIKHGSEAVRFMLSKNIEDCKKYLADINSLNNERKKLDLEITEQALDQLKDLDRSTTFSTIVYNPEWNKGGWDSEKNYVAMTAPYYCSFAANPKAWSGSTKGLVKGEVVFHPP